MARHVLKGPEPGSPEPEPATIYLQPTQAKVRFQSGNAFLGSGFLGSWPLGAAGSGRPENLTALTPLLLFLPQLLPQLPPRLPPQLLLFIKQSIPQSLPASTLPIIYNLKLFLQVPPAPASTLHIMYFLAHPLPPCRIRPTY